MESLYTDTLTLEKIHRLAVENAMAFVSYRLPGQKEPVTLLQWKQVPARLTSFNALESVSGFVFAPFDPDSGTPVRIIQPDLILIGDSIKEPDSKNNNHPDLLSSEYIYTNSENYITTRNEFIAQVDQVKKLISSKTIEKVVLSRIHREEKPKGFSTGTFFHALEQAYPDAFVFALYIPDAGLWFGATPEPLLIVGNGLITTISLAGTRRLSPEGTDLPWGEKEKNEQQIVTDYIQKVITDLCVKNIEHKGPFTCRAGKVEHLKTMFTFPKGELCTGISDFLSRLHPTPSVCGLPREISLQVIKNTEMHRREYYTGFLGPVNKEGSWDLYVNIRSMKVQADQLEYYLGAGITLWSDPEREWEETQNKMNTLKSIVDSLKL